MIAHSIIPMTSEFAAEIAGWKYPGEYAVYNMDGSADGLGGSYALLNSAREELCAKAIRLTVAKFNTRARRVYERCGFSEVLAVTHRASGEAFLIMIL